MVNIITAYQADNSEVDVTEAVQVIYDAMHSYMSMASGSLDQEEWDAVLHLAKAANFPDHDDLVAQREREIERERMREERRARQAEEDQRRRVDAYNRLREQVAIVDKMRADEPELAAQNLTFGQLITLHEMRQRGEA